MNEALSLWIEIPVALLLVLSGIFTLSSAVGLVRFHSFFQRMHPPALAFSFASWCVTLASILYFSALDHKLSLHAWLIIIFLSLTVPVTTILLARTELFRKRTGGHGDEVPLPVGQVAAASPQTTSSASHIQS
ncbi:Na+/H+ antiporter subunit G [Rhodoferax saidenbachensis]|uniref:Na+/H+ antiporter subunit G n=1 Tax=Rhodoferax saidenbachensis TaxID=1484693 RepID=A0A1P8KBN4_9BURK|nr:Na+/H+ antiporter subunit G [Rhodoferax saidenbachensis]APW43410.1 Na+/H+ antiporter subunit G [Rhodoferax saidenbachensis]